jgi:hypothetical protein
VKSTYFTDVDYNNMAIAIAIIEIKANTMPIFIPKTKNILYTLLTVF